ncbi:monosaccharide ABC transporter substrate-binding protein, CUT2 family [Blastococcus sp. DSM 46786]|uniref:sugar ABC transporter substrate-binding protein n=1 Tax=Blastococcus sp. DSM 46786 TaxID=1798227 RepID=UPI0008CDBE8F|nr:sugar ABC transporter substrate-binding protein [Blastococcus sp. DSM 46786]SEM08092.1 monosaccharide ABC transporter substrate-binding protein, CUT2 family [Blastococcus sp. DSM 46786]
MAARMNRSRGTALIGSVVVALALSACGESSAEAEGEGSGSTGACAPEDVTLVGQVRNQTNPYEAAWLEGGDAFAESVGLEQQKLTYDGDSQQQQEQIRQVLASGDASCTVINALPNGDSDTTPIVNAADGADAWLVTQWNKPADLDPTAYDRWVAHLTYDGVESGYQIAKALFEEMGGSGGVIALQGILDTAAAQDRFLGLQKALEEYPDITLLDDQTADFDRATALEVTRTLLTQHGEEVGGIWAANDDMALGAVQALEAAGVDGVAVAGIDAVPEALEAIADGSMTATVSSDGPWQGAVGLAMGYCAATGELDVASIDAEDRAFFAEQFLITEDNVGEFSDPQLDMSEFDCDSLFSRATGPIAAS